jgi:hypothetical protein
MKSYKYEKLNNANVVSLYVLVVFFYAYDMQTQQDSNALRSFSGQQLKKMVIKSGTTKEQVVAHVQDKGHRFSITGLDRMYRGELPKTEPTEILAGIAEKLKCDPSDFMEVRQQELF